MPTPTGSTSTPVPAAPLAGLRSLHLAWGCVTLIPVAFIAAFVLGEWLVVIMVALGLAAAWLGLRARRLGIPNGIIPAVVGVGVAVFAVLGDIVPLLLGAG